MSVHTVGAAAELLDTAALHGQLLDPLSADDPGLDVVTGYAIQDALLERHVRRGDRIVGAKLGLTSVAKQQEMAVHEPIGGWLTDRMELTPGAALDTDGLAQPRCEPEIAFRLHGALSGARTTAVDVMAATGSLMAAIEVLDSRYRDYRFTLPDVIADDASAARYLLGDPVDPGHVDRIACGVRFWKDTELVATATGAAVMGDPAEAVAWWVRRLAPSGRGLAAGMVVLSGALTGAQRLTAGSLVRVEIDGLGDLELRCR
jgi:2-oxo-3-hexenedioate decarboxylase